MQPLHLPSPPLPTQHFGRPPPPHRPTAAVCAPPSSPPIPQPSLTLSLLLHVPLTSIFSPFLNIPNNAQRVFGPPIHFATQYYDSFANGQQARTLGRFTEEVYKLGAFDMATRVVSYWHARHEKNAEAEAAAQREAAREARGSVKEKNPKE